MQERQTQLLDPADLAGSDGAAATAMRLELLSLNAALTAAGTATECTVIYRLPGMSADQRTWVATRQEAMEWLFGKIGAAMERYGLTEDDLLKPGCPIKVAWGRRMTTGNLVTFGNWPKMIAHIPVTFTVHAIATSDDQNGEDVEELEALDLNGRRGSKS
jgi:hypothetical protein